MVMFTGISEFWDDRDLYKVLLLLLWFCVNRFSQNDVEGVMHNPGFGVEAARILVVERGVYGLGIDTLSIDAGVDLKFPVHNLALRC